MRSLRVMDVAIVAEVPEKEKGRRTGLQSQNDFGI